MQRKSSKKQFGVVSEEEILLRSLYLKEFNDFFSSILSIPGGEFLTKLTKRVEYVNAKKFNDFSDSVKSRVEEYFIGIIFPSEYKICFTAMKAIKKKVEANPNYQSFKGNFIQHCSNNTKPIHSCGNNLYLFTYNRTIEGAATVKESYLLCPKCDEIYKDNFVKLNCEQCNVNFYSKTNLEYDNENNFDYQLATWETYHCNNMSMNNCMQCFQCQSPLYLNIAKGSNKLVCRRCNTSIKQEKAVWKCVICKDNFYSKAKALNQYEYINKKLCIKEAIVNREKAKPSKIFCCNKVDVNKTKFYHNEKCKGELVLSVLNNKNIIVCNKCESFKEYEGYLWTCPKCNEKFIDQPNATSLSSPDEEINAPITKKPIIIASETKEKCHKKRKGLLYDSAIKLNTEVNDHNLDSLSPKVSTPFELVRERRRTSAKKLNEDLLRSSLIKSPRPNLKNIGPLYKSSFKNVNESNLLNKSPLLPVKLNLATKFLKMKIFNFEEDASALPIEEDVIKENELTKKINKDISKSNLYSTASSNEPSEQSNPNTLKNSIKANVSSQCKGSEEKVEYPQFDINQYKIIKQIGVGAFGKIYLAESPQKDQFAIKKIVGTSMEELQSLKIEYEILLSLHKKNKNLNLVQIQGMHSKQLDQTTFVMYVLMELAEKDWEKELANRSKTKSYYKESELYAILLSLIKTLAHLQRHNISHRDLKPQNILLFANSHFKLADFGEAKILRSDLPDTNKQTLRGTELYMSPILFKALRKRIVDLKYVDHNTYKSDVFSFGLCALYAATLTFQSLYEIREIYDMDRVKASLFKYLSHRYTQGMIDLIVKMLDVNEKTRCDFIELEKAFNNYCN